MMKVGALAVSQNFHTFRALSISAGSHLTYRASSPTPNFLLFIVCICTWKSVSLVAKMVKNLPVMWDNWVQSLGWEDHLEEDMTSHSSILAWRIPWTEEPGRPQSMGSQRVGHD